MISRSTRSLVYAAAGVSLAASGRFVVAQLQCVPGFADGQTFLSGVTITSLQAGDLDGNGFEDLVAGTDLNFVRLYRGIGDGTFVFSRDLPIVNGISGNSAVVVLADFDSDGDLDIAVALKYAPPSGALTIFRGNGDGSFLAGKQYQIGEGVFAMVSAELDGANGPDLVLLKGTTPGLGLLHNLNNPNAMFDAPYFKPTPGLVAALGTGPQTIGGLLDDAYVAYGQGLGSSFVQRYANDGSGDLLATGAPKWLLPTWTPSAIFVGRVNSDAFTDVVTASGCNGCSPSIAILAGGANGTFAAGTAPPSGESGSGIVVADVNGNGVADIVSGNANSRQILVLRGQSNGSFAEAMSFPVGVPVRHMVKVDADRDGRADIVVYGGGNFDSPRIRVMRNVSLNPAFTKQPPRRAVSVCSQNKVFDVTVAGQGPFTFRWRRNGINLAESAKFVGAASSSLTVVSPTALEAGTFDCVVSNSCGTTVSYGGVLSICAADLTCDEVVDDADFLRFVGAYSDLVCPTAGGCPADFNGDGFVDDADFQVFVVAYNALLCS